jgi:hypothetical protein
MYLIIPGYIDCYRQRFMPVLFDNPNCLVGPFPVKVQAGDPGAELCQNITELTPEAATSTGNYGCLTGKVEKGMDFVIEF